jgi:hypothetical protein
MNNSYDFYRIKMVKVKLTVSILPELIRWIDEQVEKGEIKF